MSLHVSKSNFPICSPKLGNSGWMEAPSFPSPSPTAAPQFGMVWSSCPVLLQAPCSDLALKKQNTTPKRTIALV